jgi:uncharacterized protein involved in exopolysaccharide biosynthesis
MGYRFTLEPPIGREPEDQREFAPSSSLVSTLLWQERRRILRVASWLVLATTVAVFLIPSRYQSTARLMPPDTQTGGLAALASIATGATGASTAGGGGVGLNLAELLGGKNTTGLIIGVLKSRTVQDQLVDSFDLRRVYWVSKWEDAREILASRTIITEDKKSGIVTVSVADRNPQRAQAMAQLYVDELNRLLAKLSTSSAGREREFIEQRLVGVKAELDRASKEFSEFSSSNSTLDLREQGRAMLETAASLEAEIIAAQSQAEGLEQIYTANNVRVRALRAQIAELQRRMEKIRGQNPQLESDNQPTNEGYPSVRALPLLGVKYADLYRRARIQETVYEILTKQYELAKIQEAKEIPTIKVLDVPKVAERKAAPSRGLWIGASAVFGVLFGICYCLVLALWNVLPGDNSAKQLAFDATGSLERKTHQAFPPDSPWRTRWSALRLWAAKRVLQS